MSSVARPATPVMVASNPTSPHTVMEQASTSAPPANSTSTQPAADEDAGPTNNFVTPTTTTTTKNKHIISFSKRMEISQAKALQHAGEPDNWFSRKLMVGIVLALIAWSYYVIVGRVCAPMIQKKSGAGGNVGQGVGLLVGYNIIWLMFMWTYVKLVLTDPGWAKDVAQPGQQMRTPPFEPFNGNTYVVAEPQPGTGGNTPPPLAIPQTSEMTPEDPRMASLGASPSSIAGMYAISDDDSSEAADHAGNFDGLRNMIPSELPVPFSTAENQHEHDTEPRHSQGNTITTSHTRVESITHLAPSKTSEQRTNDRAHNINPEDVEWPFPATRLGQAYCNHCNIWKPDRAHHCRHCGTCVLAMDHHCPWIGQCVGWKNRKFFVNFCAWSTLYTLYIIAVLIADLSSRTGVDPQMIALAAIAGFFALFTGMMGVTQIQLLASALTTIESYSIRTQRDRERAILSRLGFCAFRDKLRTKRRWEKEWGKFETEGNRWWVGPAGREIRETMGDDPWGWIFPICRPKGDGMTYTQNPRFGPGGLRRRRDEWPESLR